MTARARAQSLALLVMCSMACSESTSTPTSATTAPGFTFSSTFTSNGSAARSFTTGDHGTIAATLTSVTPAVVLSVGVGIPRADGGGCSVTTEVTTASGTTPQLSVTAEPGTYCVKVSDKGQLQETAAFSVTVTYP
jgi:hypothetical protein